MEKCKYDVDAYELPVLSESDLYDIKCGVYFLFSYGYGELLYVGKSKRLRSRIHQHLSKFNDIQTYTRGLKRFCIGYKAIAVPEEDLDDTERFFIAKYNPPMNYFGTKKPCCGSYNDWLYQRIYEYDAWERASAHK